VKPLDYLAASWRCADERAATLAAAAERHNDRPMHASEKPVYDRVVKRFLSSARERLGAGRWQQVCRAGRVLAIDEAIAFARGAG
jgi:hypothetical protein